LPGKQSKHGLVLVTQLHSLKKTPSSFSHLLSHLKISSLSHHLWRQLCYIT